MNKIRAKVEAQLRKRFELYLDQMSDEELIGQNATIPLWLAVCKLFDLVAPSERSTDLVFCIREGKITKVYLREEYLKVSQEYSTVLNEMKGMLK